MKILIHGLNFAPELTGIGRYTGEMADYLTSHGHQLHVVTTPPYYPHWQVGAGYSSWRFQKETWAQATVYRCPLWVPRKPTGAKRMLHLVSFALSSLPVMIKEARWNPDLVINIAPAIASSPISLFASRLAGSKSWLHIQDFELDAAANLEMLPVFGGGRKVLEALEASLLKRFDRVSTISRCMVERIYQKGVPPGRAALFPNWVDENKVFPLAGPNPYRKEWGIDPDQKIILYAGNMGYKQGLEVLVEAARLLSAEKQLVFILCGEGAACASLQESGAGLANLRFLPLQPENRLNELLNAADIHVLTQRACSAGLVMPSKLGNMLASGKPVIATACPDTDLGEIVLQTGCLVPPEEPRALAEAILSLSRQPARQEEIGWRGRAYVEKHLSKELILSEFMEQVEQLAHSN